MIERIIELLRHNGHVVETHFEESREISSLPAKINAFASGIWSFASRRALAVKVAQFKPDIVQVQNLYPLVSPSVLPALKRSGVPIVMRLSNYRLICPSGLFLSHGELCQRCRGGREYWCILRNCEGSHSKSLGYALRNWFARRMGFYTRNVSMFYAQTEFQKSVLVDEGFDADRIGMIPNMVEPPRPAPVAASAPAADAPQVIGSHVGFVGRMSPEKGVDVFLAAAEKCPGISFKVAGDPVRYKHAGPLPANVELLGHLDRPALEAFYQDCRFVVVPSRWFEGFPGVIIEAMRHAKPVLASRIGGLREIIDDGVTGHLFTLGDSAELARMIAILWEDAPAIERLGAAGRDKVTAEYSPDVYYQRLMAVYAGLAPRAAGRP